jgi:hypothetical protein
MHFQKIVFVCLILTCIVAFSCQKLEKTQPIATLKLEQLKSPDTIPLEFGKLVGVTTSSEYPGWGQLWFEKPDKSIVIVSVNWGKGYLNQNAWNIPRR